MDLRILTLTLKILLESNPLKSRILVRGLAALAQMLRLGRSSLAIAGMRERRLTSLRCGFQNSNTPPNLPFQPIIHELTFARPSDGLQTSF